MSTNESTKTGGASQGVAQAAPTEQQASKSGAPKRFEKGQTVCNVKDEKGKLHNGHLKQVSPIREDARQHMRGDDLLYRCQTCGTLYMGPPLGHVRDPGKQARYVQSELVTILEAAGGTLPAFKKNATGAWVPVNDPKPHAPANAKETKPAVTPKPKTTPAAPAATPAANTAAAAPSDETPEQKRARIIAEAKAKAAARMAGGATTSTGETPTATPIATDTTAAAAAPSDETPEQKRARIMAEVKAKAAARMAAKGEAGVSAAASTPAPPSSPASGNESSTATTATTPAAPVNTTPLDLAAGDVPSDETPEQKRARQMAEIKAKAAARMAAKNNPGGATTGGETSIATPPLSAQPPSPTSGTDSSPSADAHRPAAEAQAATGQASAAPLSPAAATASPAAGAETPADLAPGASTELTPGAPRDERDADEGTNG